VNPSPTPPQVSTQGSTQVSTQVSTQGSTQPRLEIERLALGYGDRDVIKELDLVVPPGEVTAIVGPNACGKSTLLRSMTRLLAPRAGQVLLDGKAVHSMPAKQLARRLGLLPQSPIAPEGITVGDLVGRGRHPHQRALARWSRADDEAVTAALKATETIDLVDRAVDELSGGQRQRVWIAMALAQQTEILLLDEPTTFLDVSHQIEVLDLLTDLNRSKGTTIVMVLHDLNLAARYADHLIALVDGRVEFAGDPGDVLTEESVRAVFGLDSRVVTDPLSGKPLMLPIGRHHVTEVTEVTGVTEVTEGAATRSR
jgi:iron complex transport system ATP-binding protein